MTEVDWANGTCWACGLPTEANPPHKSEQEPCMCRPDDHQPQCPWLGFELPHGDLS